MFTETLEDFFQSADFAIASTYDATGVNTTINVIFDRAYISALGVAGTNPVALAKTSDVAADPTGKTIAVSGTTYTIRGFEPQDDGAIVLLQLEAP